jgi:assimilatory nitrate reductase catalytic subunit
MLPVAALTHCPYCALNCGLALREQAGTVVGFDRWKRSPLTRGALCSKGVTAWEQMPHADRIVRPLVRVRGRLVETSWETALDQAAAGFVRIAARQGDAANAVLSGGSLTNEVAYLVGKFARLALRTPHIDLNGRMCMTSAGAAYTQTFGVDRAPTPLAELARADAAVVIGANLSSTFPVVIPSLLAKLRRRGGTVIVVDPRAGRFVADGDCWLPLRPGTDAVVANGLLREIARLGAIDESFCSARTTGLGDALAAAEPWSPEAVEATADVPAARLREAAATLARADRVMYLHARGAEQQVTGVRNVRAWLNVALSRGHVGRPGCGIDMRNGQGGREHGQRCDQLPSGRSIENPDHRHVVAGRWGVDEAALPRKGRTYVELIADARAGSVAGMLLLSTNPMVSAPDLDHTATALDTLEHLVVIDPFLSETAARAHVVLPGTTFGEIEGTITSLEGRVLRCDQAVPPAAGRSEIDILRNLANRLGAGRHFRHTCGRDVFDELRQVSAGGPVDYAGITWARLRDGDGVFWPGRGPSRHADAPHRDLRPCRRPGTVRPRRPEPGTRTHHPEPAARPDHRTGAVPLPVRSADAAHPGPGGGQPGAGRRDPPGHRHRMWAGGGPARADHERTRGRRRRLDGEPEAAEGHGVPAVPLAGRQPAHRGRPARSRQPHPQLQGHTRAGGPGGAVPPAKRQPTAGRRLARPPTRHVGRPP